MQTLKPYNLGAFLLTWGISLNLPYNTLAQTCVAVPACDELGYDLSAADCTDKEYIKCPFDKEKVYCLGEEKNKCDPCEGYAYTYAQATATGYVIDGDGCQSCDGMKYKRKASPCIGFNYDETNCPTTSCGGPGGGSCPSGSKIKYRTCNNECPEEPEICYGRQTTTNIVCASCVGEGCTKTTEWLSGRNEIPCPEDHYCCAFRCNKYNEKQTDCLDAVRLCCKREIVPCD